MKPKRSSENELIFDRQVGSRLRQLRLAAGLTQTDLGKLMNLSFQQIQKYENGNNRLTAGKLITLSSIFNIPVERFFIDQHDNQSSTASPVSSISEGGSPDKRDPMHREMLNVMRAYSRIDDVHTRKCIFSLIRHLSDHTAERGGHLNTAA